MKCHLRELKIIKDVNDDETLVLSSFGEVLEVNESGKSFYKTIMDIVERTYRCTFDLKYKINLVSPKTWLYINYMKYL